MGYQASVIGRETAIANKDAAEARRDTEEQQTLRAITEMETAKLKKGNCGPCSDLINKSETNSNGTIVIIPNARLNLAASSTIEDFNELNKSLNRGGVKYELNKSKQSGSFSDIKSQSLFNMEELRAVLKSFVD
jgi:hypothetical protein